MLCTLFAAFCLFQPPDGWELSNPKTPSQHSICGFLDTSRSGFCPSLHLTYEKTSCSIEKYLEVVSNTAKSKRQKWRRMGTVKTQSGLAHLAEIEVCHSLGKVCLLQAILPADGEVHILTAGALKRDLAKCAPIFHKAFQSMRVIEDLIPLSRNPDELYSSWQKREEDPESYSKAVMKENALGAVYQIQLMRFK